MGEGIHTFLRVMRECDYFVQEGENVPEGHDRGLQISEGLSYGKETQNVICGLKRIEVGARVKYVLPQCK